MDYSKVCFSASVSLLVASFAIWSFADTSTPEILETHERLAVLVGLCSPTFMGMANYLYGRKKSVSIEHIKTKS